MRKPVAAAAVAGGLGVLVVPFALSFVGPVPRQMAGSSRVV